MVEMTKNTNKRILLILALIFTLFFTGCSRISGEKTDKEARKSGITVDGKLQPIELAEAFIDEIAKFIQLGEEYKKMGMRIQSKYAYGYTAATISSMRLCVDTLLYISGEGATLDEVIGSRLDDWDEIAAYNYASPYPWVFEGLSLHAQDKLEEAKKCYQNAALNPEYDIESGDDIVYVLASLNTEELDQLKLKLIDLEDKIFETGIAEPSSCPRDEYCFSDIYLTALGQEKLKESGGDFSSAVVYFEAALEVNPFNGDNFVSCAYAALQAGDMDKTIYYVNEGLWADPEHEGLNLMADLLNERRP